MNQKKLNVRTMTQLALLIAVEIAMKAIGLGSVPVGPLYMSFLTVPVAVGAIVLGPISGAILGGVFGIVSFKDALTGASAMTSALLMISPIHTFILCIGTRVLMGACTGLIYLLIKKLLKENKLRYLLAALAAPLLNTLFFMGYIVLIFYNSDYIQGLVSLNGASNPIMFVLLLVGVQGLIEAIVCAAVGGAASRGAELVIKNKN